MVGPSARHAAASPRHHHAEPGSGTSMLVGRRIGASDPGVSGGITGSDEATSPGAAALGGAAGWEGWAAPLSPIHDAQDHITGHPNLPQRFTSQR